jgi:hypothetical protein
VANLDPFKQWDRLPVRYRYAAGASLAFVASVAAGAADFRWATPVWVIAGLGGAFLCIYAFPSVWRYLVYMLLIYSLLAAGMLMPLFWLRILPLFLGASIVLHIVAIVFAYNFVKDVILTRRAYHEAAARDGKTAPYVSLGTWFLALLAFIVLTDLSMVGFSMWAQGGSPLYLYLGCELAIIPTMMFLLEKPERAFGGKGADFVPRVSLAEMGAETRKVMKRLVPSRPKGEGVAKKAVAKLSRRPPAVPRTLPVDATSCPACGADLKLDVRRCPECYKENNFAWCPASEHYIIACPSCGSPTVYGEPACRVCGKPLNIAYTCPACQKATPLNRWGRA